MSKRLHILLIDDDDCMSVRRALSSADMDVHVVQAITGPAAIELLRKHDFDCVLMDHHVPDRDGLGVLSAVRGADIETPIIMMTAQGSEQLAVEMMKAGANDYIPKSNSLDQLGQRIRNGVRVHRAETIAARIREDLEDHQRVTEALHRIGGMLAVERDVQRLVQTVTDEATALSGAAFGAFVYNTVNEHGEAETLCTVSGAPREAFEKFPIPRNTEDFGPSFRDDGAVRLDDVTKEPRYARNAAQGRMPLGDLPVRSYLAVPVVSRSDEVLGGLFFGHPEPARFTDRDEQLVVGIAAQAAISIDNARLVDALKHGQEQYRFLAEAIPQMVWTTRPDGYADYFNPRWYEYTGTTPETALGWNWKDVIHPDDLPLCLDRWDRSVKTGEVYEIEYRFRRASDGEYRWQLGRGIPMLDANGRIIKWFGTCTDIHDRKMAEEALRVSKDSAEAANRAKDQFLSVLSHELRTPLTPVLMTVQSLEMDSSLPSETRSALGMVRRNVELEARLIDDLLDLTRIAKGKLQLNIEVTDVHESLQRALEICSGEVAEKGLVTRLECDAGSAKVKADPARLQQVFWNLIKNAVKFTPQGGELTFRCSHAPGGMFRVEVIDSGIGIEPTALEKIFDAFEQGESALARQFGGLGLGLAISRAIVELHGGSMSARSEGLNRGATFTVDLPAASAVAAASPLPPNRERIESSGMRILLVDDHEDTNRAMKRLLERLGYSVSTAHSVGSALSAADKTPFDILISDIGLPDGSGIELMAQLLKRSPVKGIALSGFGMEEDVRKSMAAGFVEHLTKPVNFMRLEAAIKKLTAGELA